MKNQNSNSAKQMNQHNTLIWIKRSGNKQKNISAISSLNHNNLGWLQIKGYQPKISSHEQLQMSGTVYHRIELIKAQHKFYSVAMATMMLSLLLLALAF